MSAVPSPPYISLTERLAMVPVAHGVQAFADEVRRAVALFRPDCIAVELPRPLAPSIKALVTALPQMRLLAYRLQAGKALMIPGDPCDALIEAVRLASDGAVPLELVDVLEASADEPFAHLPDEQVISEIGLEQYALLCAAALPPHPPTEREKTIAARLVLLEERHERVLFVGGLGHMLNIQELLNGPARKTGDPRDPEKPVEIRMLPLRERQLAHVLNEVPYSAYLYEMFRSAHGPEDRFPMLKALSQIARTATERYRDEYDEEVSLTEWRALFQYGRNLALVRGMVRPRLYELAMAAKGCVNDDFGAICLELALSYPPNHDPNDQESLLNKPDDPHHSPEIHCQFGSEMCRLRHAYPYYDEELNAQAPDLTLRFRRRPTTAQQWRWQMEFGRDLWEGAGICSWPPEDLFIEKFFHTIRQRALQQIGEEHTTTEEFTTSLLDGLDLRETMRRWHDKKLIVRRERTPPGRVGPVVLLWHDLPIEVDGVWKTCLYAENQNESDIAVFAKPLGQTMVGPGISRTEYFGILSVFPACGIPDVWGFLPVSFERFRTCGKLLLAAAIVLSEERYVAYVAAEPPDAELRQFARDHGRAIIYLPLALFSRTLLKRARQCHILAGRNVRGWAGDYIPPM